MYYKNLEESEIVQWPFLGEGIVFDQLKEPTRVWTADRHADQPIVVPFKKFASKIGKVTTPTSVPSHGIDRVAQDSRSFSISHLNGTWTKLLMKILYIVNCETKAEFTWSTYGQLESYGQFIRKFPWCVFLHFLL